MNMDSFRYLLEINRLHSISGAAKSLHIRQTTLSAALKSAEDELGFPVFQRSPAGVITTPAGEHFMELAWEIHVRYERLLGLRGNSASGGITLTILLAPSVATSLPVRLSGEYSKGDFRATLYFEECPSVDMLSRMDEKASNIGIAYFTDEQLNRFREDAEKSKITIRKLLKDKIYLIASLKNPASASSRVTADDLKRCRVAVQKKLREDPVFGRILNGLPHITKFSDVELIKKAVLEENMVAFLPGYNLLNSQDFAILDTSELQKCSEIYMCLLSREERWLRYQEKSVVSVIKGFFAAFAKQHPDFVTEVESE